MSPFENSDALVSALRGALPYLRLYQGRTFVVKAGGAALDRPEDVRALVHQIALLHRLGIRVALVHGGGSQVTRIAEQLGLPTRKVDGRRVTDDRTMEVATMVLNGTIRTSLVAAFREAGAKAVGISGVDGGLIDARRRPPRRQENGEVVDFGLVGDIVDLDPTLVRKLMDDGYVPVISPISAASDGTVLNINADVVASSLSVALEAEKLIVVTDAAGILEDPADVDSLVSYTDLPGLARLEEGGSFADGMLPKVACLRQAIYGGVPRAHLISFRLSDGLLLEVFTNEGSGTLVVLDTKELFPQELDTENRLQAMLDLDAKRSSTEEA